jgi:hypothetical protein
MTSIQRTLSHGPDSVPLMGSRLSRNEKGEPVVIDRDGRVYRVLGNSLRSGEDGYRWVGKSKSRPPTSKERVEADQPMCEAG